MDSLDQLVVTIGNASNKNVDIRIKDKSVSKKHAQLIKHGEYLVVRDLGSQNGTFVNHRRVRSKILKDPNQLVFFGETSYQVKELEKEFLKSENKDRVTFYEEFELLENVFSEYRAKVKKVKTSFSTKITLFKVGVPLLLLIVFIIFGERLGLDKSLRYIIPMVGGGLVSLLVDRIYNREDLNVEIMSIKEEYQDRLKCPKGCDYDLINKSYVYWKNKRRCPKCHANWVR